MLPFGLGRPARFANVPNSFLAVDDTEVGHGNRIPLWMFGFTY